MKSQIIRREDEHRRVHCHRAHTGELTHPPFTHPTRPPLQANDGNGDQQQRTGMENAAQITAASTRAARLAQVCYASPVLPAAGLARLLCHS